ncbi:MAG: GNAT family N-acetyltransferase [Promethearchaeota archaeon]
MISEETVSIPGISLNDLFCISTNDFLRPFEDIVNPDIHKGMSLDFHICDRGHQHKLNPILRLARPEDAVDIVEIYKELYDGTYPYKEMEDVDEVEKMIRDPSVQWIIFQDPSYNIAGCITFVIDFKKKRGYIRGFMLKKKYQGYIDITKAMIGSMIGMCHKYKNTIFIWYVENRTAHAKSQYSMRVCGISPIGFYPNKDIFLGKVESDLMQILYDERALHIYRNKQIPQILPEVKKCFLYSNKRYNLGQFKIKNPSIKLDFNKIGSLKDTLIKNVKVDKFGYEMIKFSFKGQNSFFKFLYTPNVQNFEKTKYQVSSLEELYVFIQEFMNCKKELNVRYCEIFLSAYNPYHQKMFLDAGFSPRGYIPSWKYNKKLKIFEDYILFNCFKGHISNEIQLIQEGWDLFTIINTRPNRKIQERKNNHFMFLERKRFKYFSITSECNFLSPKLFSSLLMGGLCTYIAMLIISIIIAYLSRTSNFRIITHEISCLGSKHFTPLPLLFNSACILGGITAMFLNLALFKHLLPRGPISLRGFRLGYEISRSGLICGMVGNVGYILVGVFSLDRAGPKTLIHGSFASMAFGGFTLSLLSFSICIMFYQVKIPKIYGVIGLVGPSSISIIHCILPYPLLEWILLFTILISLIPQFIWMSIKEFR